MAKITITFQEEGSDPIILEIPSETSMALDKYIEEENRSMRVPLQPSIEGVPPIDLDSDSKYTGKADLFLKHTLTTLIEPIITKYFPVLVDEPTAIQLLSLKTQKEQIETEITNAFKPRFLTD